MKSELENYQRLMALCRLKLDQYLFVIEPTIPAENDAAQQALAGLHQLKHLLDAASTKELDSSPAVEVAAEAGPESPASVETTPRTTATVKHRSNVPQKRPPSVDMTVFKQLTLSSPTSDLPRDYPAQSPQNS